MTSTIPPPTWDPRPPQRMRERWVRVLFVALPEQGPSMWLGQAPVTVSGAGMYVGRAFVVDSNNRRAPPGTFDLRTAQRILDDERFGPARMTWVERIIFVPEEQCP